MPEIMEGQQLHRLEMPETEKIMVGKQLLRLVLLQTLIRACQFRGMWLLKMVALVVAQMMVQD